MQVGVAGIDPGRHMRCSEAVVAGCGREIKELLPRRHDPPADGLGKQLGQPGAAREDILARLTALAICADPGKGRALRARGVYRASAKATQQSVLLGYSV